MSKKEGNRKRTTKNSKKQKESDSSDSETELHPSRPQYKGDENRKWKQGEVVWAKYKNYPWWTGTIELSENESESKLNTRSNSKSNTKSNTKSKSKSKAKRKQTKKNSSNNETNTVRVRWFGDFGSVVDNCKLKNVIPFTKSKMNEILKEVRKVDVDSFKQSCHEAEKVDSELREEKGSKSKQLNKKKTTKYNKKTKNNKNRNNNNNDNNSNSEESSESEEEEDIDIIGIGNKKKHKRPSYRSSKNKETKPPPPPRRSKRLTKSSDDDDDTNNNDNENSNNSSNNSINNNRRSSARLRQSKTDIGQSTISGRKRKREETLNNSESKRLRYSNNDNSSNSDNSSKTKNKSKNKEKKPKSILKTNDNNNINININSNNTINESGTSANNLRRSTRLNMQNYPSLNGFGILTQEDHSSHWQTSLDMILDVNSAEDLTPFVSLVLHGLMKNSKLSYQSALKLSCDIWDFDLNALDAHMDYFYQDETKFRRKQRASSNRK